MTSAVPSAARKCYKHSYGPIAILRRRFEAADLLTREVPSEAHAAERDCQIKTSATRLLTSPVELAIKRIEPDCNGRFSFLGHVDNSAMQKYFSSSNVLVVTSVTESFSLVVLEAILSGLKVVGVPIEAFSEEVFEEGVQFASSRHPKDLALAIQNVIASSGSTKPIGIEQIMSKYQAQERSLLHWLG